MAKKMTLFSAFTLIACAAICFYLNSNAGSDAGHLDPQFYSRSCPRVQQIVRSNVAKAIAKEARMGASLVRLHFHDCFVKGCDASILLDDTNSLIGEKRSRPNRDSARGFEVVDDIKSAVDKECNQTVSCADILALAARDSVVLVSEKQKLVDRVGKFHWGRDSRSASLGGSNNNIPAPNTTFHTILNKFELQDLDIIDLVALSGSHTIGSARCVSFRQSLYNQSAGISKLDESHAALLRARCPKSGGDENVYPLDFVTPSTFDNSYFKNLLSSKGLLSSDRALVSKNGVSMELVKIYAESNELFFQQFAKSMVKMGIFLH
ncbi:UNVERIFIED_CONTAM: Peroxidase 72 [Sesamum angustifolium]|uniref:Peroxidase n=1 Tax=Sesamum angustifolium TaxID=2727405 RepID=A0AAW2QRT1_9LAMI